MDPIYDYYYGTDYDGYDRDDVKHPGFLDDLLDRTDDR